LESFFQAGRRQEVGFMTLTPLPPVGTKSSLEFLDEGAKILKNLPGIISLQPKRSILSPTRYSYTFTFVVPVVVSSCITGLLASSYFC
jgi:hypothetical protein